MRRSKPLLVLIGLQSSAFAQPAVFYDGVDFETRSASEAAPVAEQAIGPEEQAFVQQMMQQAQNPGQVSQSTEQQHAQLLLAAYRQALQQVVRRPNAALEQMVEQAQDASAEAEQQHGLPPEPEDGAEGESSPALN